MLTIVGAFWAGTVLVDQVLVAVRAFRTERSIARLERELLITEVVAGTEAAARRYGPVLGDES